MPIVIDGYIAVSVKKLAEHEHHPLFFRPAEGDKPASLWCDLDLAMVEQEHKSRPSLWCGCPDQAEHDEGVALQTKFRKDYRMTKSACVGCYLGDDGPSMHSCYVHPIKDWPTKD